MKQRGTLASPVGVQSVISSLLQERPAPRSAAGACPCNARCATLPESEVKGAAQAPPWGTHLYTMGRRQFSQLLVYRLATEIDFRAARAGSAHVTTPT